MTCLQCNVFPAKNGGWLAHVENREVGPYISQELALQVAIAAALQLRRLGGAARVTVRDCDGNICAEHCCAERCLCEQLGH
jgi:hypothetical protein